MNNKKWAVGIIAIIIIMAMFSTVVIIPAGHTGVVVTLGATQDEVLQEGIHIKTPFITKIKKIDNRVVRVDVDCSSVSKDLQAVGATVSINYRVDKTLSSTIYKNVGGKYEDVIVKPAVQECVKSATAQHTAEELITKRQAVGEQIKDSLAEKISPYGLSIEIFNIINFNFSEEFNKAIEEKQTAQQDALKAEQDLARIKVEAEQKVTEARAEAESYKLKSQEVTDSMLQLEAIKKWDGKMPTYYTSGSDNIFNIPIQ